MSKAVVFFADGTEECEALLVVDLLRRARVEVIVASAMGRRELVSSHKIPLTADALAEEVDYSDVDMVVLPGGIPGTPNLAANKTVWAVPSPLHWNWYASWPVRQRRSVSGTPLRIGTEKGDAVCALLPAACRTAWKTRRFYRRMDDRSGR